MARLVSAGHTHTHLFAVNAGGTLNQQSGFCKVQPGFAAVKGDAHLIQLQIHR